MIVTASEMKNNFGRYLKHVTDDSAEIVVTKNNLRVARLVPYISDIEKYFFIKENAVDYGYDRKRVSYEEFMEIYEKTDSRMEYINGEIFMMTSPSLYHQSVLGILYVHFIEFFRGKKCKPIIAPLDVHFRKKGLKDPDVMQPDLVVLCDLENNVNEKGRYMGTPTLAIEILSPGTRTKDMVYKLNTFMLSGTSEYWMVDPEQKRVILYHFIDCQTDRMEVYKTGEIVKSVCFEGLELAVDTLFEEIF